jgi:hypothetical protein
MNPEMSGPGRETEKRLDLRWSRDECSFNLYEYYGEGMTSPDMMSIILSLMGAYFLFLSAPVLCMGFQYIVFIVPFSLGLILCFVSWVVFRVSRRKDVVEIVANARGVKVHGERYFWKDVDIQHDAKNRMLKIGDDWFLYRGREPKVDLPWLSAHLNQIKLNADPIGVPHDVPVELQEEKLKARRSARKTGQKDGS